MGKKENSQLSTMRRKSKEREKEEKGEKAIRSCEKETKLPVC